MSKTNNYTRIYPSDNDGVVHLDGGLNSNFPRSLILDNESPDCLNVTFKQGSVETRGGSQKLNTTAIGTFAIDGLYTRISNGGNQTMVAFAGGTAWYLATTTFITISSAQSVFTAGVRVGAVNYENQLFCGNGGVIPYRYTGTDFVRHGVYPPTTTHTAATNGGGTLTGGYTYKVTWVNSNLVESDVGPVNSTLTVASQQVLLTSIPVAPQSYGVSSRYIYRTSAGGSTYKLLTVISNNTATTYADNNSDSTLGVSAPVDQGVPPLYSKVIQFQDRLFVNDPANPNQLTYSELGEPYTFKSENFETAGDNSADLVRGFEAYNNSVVIFGDMSITVIYMPDTDPANWVRVVLNSSYGSKSPHGVSLYKNMLFFPAVLRGVFQGFGALNGESLVPSTDFLTVGKMGGNLITTKVQDQMDSIQKGYVANISSVVFNDQVYFAVTYGANNTTNNRIYVLDFQNDNISKVQTFSIVPYSGLNISQFTVYNNTLYGGSSTTNGFVYELENSSLLSDSGTAIDSYFWTKEFGGYKDDVNFNKDFRFLNLLFDLTGDYFMQLRARVDSDSGVGDSYQIDLSPSSATWGFTWGAASWGGGQEQKDYKLFLGSLRGKRIQFRFSNLNTVAQKFKIAWLKYAYNLKGYR